MILIYNNFILKYDARIPGKFTNKITTTKYDKSKLNEPFKL